MLLRLSVIILLFFVFASCTQRQGTASSPGSATIDTLLLKGKMLEQSDYDSACTIYASSLQQAKQQNYNDGIFTAYRYLVFNTGILQGNFNKGLKWSNEGLAAAKDKNKPQHIGDMLSMRAMLYHAHSRLDSAAVFYKDAINTLESKNNTDTAALLPLYNNISGLYNLLGNHQLAKEYLQQYIRLVKQQKDTAALIGAYSNMYVFCNALRDTAQAADMLFRAKKMLALTPENDAAPMVYSNLSEMYNNKNQYDSAAYYSTLRLQNALALKDTLSIIKGYDNLILAQLGLNDLKSAGSSLEMLQSYTQSFTPPLYQQRDIAWILYSFNKKQGNNSLAFTALEKYNDLYTQIRSMEMNKDLENFEKERERSKQEKNLLSKQLQINKKNSAIALLCALLVLLTGIGVAVVMWYRKRQGLQQKQIVFLEKEKDWNRTRSLLEGQLEERNRISRELHDDLGASLTSIALASKLAQNKASQNNSESLEIIANSSTEMVQTLNEIVWTLNSRNDSLQSLIAYIRKFATGFLSKANIDFNYSENLPVADAAVNSNTRRAIYLTAKEIFNNIVKHSGASMAVMNVQFEHDVLTITIKDNGKGFSNNVQQGNGLLNMQKNLSLVNGSCRVQPQDGVAVTISCPIKNAQNI